MSFTRLRSLSLAIIVMPVGIASAQLPPAPYVAPAPILNQVLRWRAATAPSSGVAFAWGFERRSLRKRTVPARHQSGGQSVA